jgi:hypothetical protein
MDWQALRAGMRVDDSDLPERAGRLVALRRVLDGTQYDHLAHPFSDEKRSGTGEYIPLKDRRPSVRTNLCRTVVDDVVSLLFGDGHFPTILATAEATRAGLAALAKRKALGELMMHAATVGSVGSVAIWFRAIEGRPYFDVLPTEYLTPVWRRTDPDALESVEEKYKVPARRLRDMGYAVAEDAGMHWFRRVWDAEAETWYQPWPVSEREHAPVADPARSVTHGLGFVPLIWVRNLPGGDRVDGCSTFARAIDTVVELDYLLSQGGRGLKYSSDPTLVLKGGDENAGTAHTGGAASALVVPPEGDAKLLEINGAAAGAVLNHIRELRTTALEMMHGNRAHPDKMTAAQSGRAMELLNQGLVWLAGKLRTSYGEGALLALLRMVCRASQVVKGGLLIGNARVTLADDGLGLKWPDWYPPTADDRVAEVNALTAAITGGVVSRETAVQTAMSFYDIEDLQAELSRIKADMAEADARTKALEAAVNATAKVEN